MLEKLVVNATGRGRADRGTTLIVLVSMGDVKEVQLFN